MTSINFNAFTQATAAGKLELSPNGAVYTVRVGSSSNVTLSPGMAVEIDTATAQSLAVKPLASDSNLIFGFVVLNHKNNALAITSTNPEYVEIASYGCVMEMTASAAINRGAYVTYASATNKVATTTTGAQICGIALDNATASGGLIKVLILAPNVPTVGA